jgi:phage/plasmid-associated DNA primase
MKNKNDSKMISNKYNDKIYMSQSVIIHEHINLKNLFYLYSLNQDKITQYFKSNTNENYHTETHNILNNYILDGKSINIKVYSNNNCNRLYCNNSLQKLQNDICNFICPDNCYDYDLKSARPTISKYLCKKNNLPYDKIHYYVINRNNIMKKYEKSKDEIKDLIVTLSNIDNPNPCGIREIDELVKQENQNKIKLLEIYKDLLPEKDYENKKNPISSKYCELYYYFENKIVSKAVDKYIDNVNCIKFDGFVSRKYIDLNEINELTNEYDVEWIIKPLNTRFEIGITDFEKIDNKLNNYLYGDFKLFNNDIDTTSTTAEKSSKYLKQTIRFCNDKWFVLDNNTKLWIIVKKPLYYFTKILKLGLRNARYFYEEKLRKEENKKEDQKDEEEEKRLREALENNLKCYKYIDRPGWCSQFQNHLEAYLKDDDFENKLDSNIFYMAFKNGIVDMKTGTFRQGIYASDYLTKTIDYDYIPREEIDNQDIDFFRTEWKKILNNNDDHFDYFMKHLAYAFTGDSDKYQTFYFCVGQIAGNGKSSIFETLGKIFNSYVANVNSQLLEEDFSKRHKLMVKLKSNRLIYLNEMKKNKKIGADIMKKISDGLTEDNEVMYGTSEEFKIQSTAFLLTNHMPDFDNMDQGVYRRYNHIQFDSEFDVSNKYNLKEDDIENKKFIPDLDFSKKMIQKKYGLVHLILEYARECIDKPLPQMPQEFKEEKELMRSVNDELKDWLEEVLIISDPNDKNKRLSKSEIIDRYKTDKNKVLNTKTLFDIMKQLGLKDRYKKDITKKGFGKGIFKGLELVQLVKDNDTCITDSDSDIEIL